MKENTQEKKWLIWSVEHSAWWAPDSRGYIRDRKYAGKYSFEEAAEICEGANRHLKSDFPPNETMVLA